VLVTAAGIADHTPHATATVRHKLGAMRATALLLNGLPYIWGGGHGGWGLQPGYDCSGFVSAVLHAGGYLTAPVNTQALPSQPGILPGPGRFVTIFDRTDAGGSDHVIIEIDGEWWESGGSTAAGGGAAVHRIAGISAAYLATFNQILHPRGL
jgi:cell wall-associated NlpC family hydrolase